MNPWNMSLPQEPQGDDLLAVVKAVGYFRHMQEHPLYRLLMLHPDPPVLMLSPDQPDQPDDLETYMENQLQQRLSDAYNVQGKLNRQGAPAVSELSAGVLRYRDWTEGNKKVLQALIGRDMPAADGTANAAAPATAKMPGVDGTQNLRTNPRIMAELFAASESGSKPAPRGVIQSTELWRTLIHDDIVILTSDLSPENRLFRTMLALREMMAGAQDGDSGRHGGRDKLWYSLDMPAAMAAKSQQHGGLPMRRSQDVGRDEFEDNLWCIGMYHKLHANLITAGEWDDLLDSLVLIISACQISDRFWLYTPMIDFYIDTFRTAVKARLNSVGASRGDIVDVLLLVQAISGLAEGCLLYSSITCRTTLPDAQSQSANTQDWLAHMMSPQCSAAGLPLCLGPNSRCIDCFRSSAAATLRPPPYFPDELDPPDHISDILTITNYTDIDGPREERALMQVGREHFYTCLARFFLRPYHRTFIVPLVYFADMSHGIHNEPPPTTLWIPGGILG